jgi:leader peptidase (prepilin peptidase)/N-methyltransferase
MTGLEIALTVSLFAALTALAVIDWRSYRLPDYLTLPLIPLGLTAAWLMDQPVWLHVLGAALGYGVLVVLEKSYEKLRGRPGLGRGDAKLFAAGGAWCGALALPLILLAASVSALVFVLVHRLITGAELKADTMIAFGPFLGFGIGFVFFAKRLGLLAFAGV